VVRPTDASYLSILKALGAAKVAALKLVEGETILRR
jgi:hypothetical protein